MTKPSTLLVSLFVVLLAVSCRSSADGPSFGAVSFSPDSKVVAFAHAIGPDCFIYLGELSTGTTKRLTKARSGCERDPSFSSDGKLIVYAYAPKNDRKSSLFVANADGSNIRQVTASGTDDLYPVFSKDGKLIYFARSGSFGHHSPLAAPRQHDFDLFYLDLSNGEIAQLTQQRLYDLRSVCLSPDGENLLIATGRYPVGDLLEIYRISEPQSARLVFQPHVPNEPRLTEPAPAFSDACYMPDGMEMLILAASNKPGGDYDYNVYKMSTVTGSIDGKLTDVTGLSNAIRPGPDGKTAILENQNKLYLLNLQNNQLKPLDWSGLGN